MEFGNMSPLFDRFKKITLPNEDVRRSCAVIIERELGVAVSIKQIQVVSSIIKLTVNPQLKNEVFMKKHIILQELEKEYKKKTPKDIR